MTDRYFSHDNIFHVTSANLPVVVQSDEISKALNHQPRDKRDILLLAYFVEMNDREIADQLQLNQRTVSRYRKQALAALRQEMEEIDERE